MFGGNDIAPYSVKWGGYYICLSKVPEVKTKENYANIGRHEWHRAEKILVRRTGDYILAAVDKEGFYASNNFFLVLPKSSCSLDLDGLCALLNSKFMTWYFRTVEPRQGRVFAELKIKHIKDFPLPYEISKFKGCQLLNELGAERRKLAGLLLNAQTASEHYHLKAKCKIIDNKIDKIILQFFGLSPNQIFTEKEVEQWEINTPIEREEHPEDA